MNTLNQLQLDMLQVALNALNTNQLHQTYMPQILTTVNYVFALLYHRNITLPDLPEVTEFVADHRLDMEYRLTATLPVIPFLLMPNGDVGVKDVIKLAPRWIRLVKTMQNERQSMYEDSLESLTQFTLPGNNKFTYDVFICHANKEPDVTQVSNILIPRLEMIGLQVAISGYLDTFKGNQTLTIKQGLQQCKYIIIVLSNNYINDILADFEQDLNQTISIQEDTYRLLPVLITPIDKSKLPIRLSILTTFNLNNPRHVEREFNRLIKTLLDPFMELPIIDY